MHPVSDTMSELYVMTWFACATRCDTQRSYNFFVELPAQNCGPEVCQAIGYDGNADIAGIGVRLSLFATR